MIKGNLKPRKDVYDHKYTGIIRCAECSSMITAEIQKGVTYYRCTKKAKDSKGLPIKCSQPYIQENNLEKQIQDNIQKYAIPEKFIEWSLGILNENNEKEQKNNKIILSQQRKKLTEIEQQLNQLIKLKISPSNSNGQLLSDEEFVEQKESLNKDKIAIKEQIAHNENNIENWLENCVDFFNFTSNCEEKWLYGTNEEKKLIFSLLFGSNATLRDRKLFIKAKKPFLETTSFDNSYTFGGT